jgi:hypothetical protein
VYVSQEENKKDPKYLNLIFGNEGKNKSKVIIRGNTTQSRNQQN